ncbi:MAG TPA: hypothetical protein VFW28_16960 [Micropepsaceae bacterium]|nr:hypothetical protein [Micropepsaceae bacterium]
MRDSSSPWAGVRGVSDDLDYLDERLPYERFGARRLYQNPLHFLCATSPNWPTSTESLNRSLNATGRSGSYDHSRGAPLPFAAPSIEKQPAAQLALTLGNVEDMLLPWGRDSMSETTKERLARELAGYPPSALAYFNAGFIAASKLTDSTRNAVLLELLANFRRGRRQVTGINLRSVTGVGVRESGQIASAFSLVVGLLSESEATPEEFVEVANGIVFDREQEGSALSIAKLVCAHRNEIAPALELARVSGLVLPSLDEVELAVDVRVSWSEGQIKGAVPVVIAHLDTDGMGQEIWFQMTRSDVEDMIKKLSESLQQMQAAESLMGVKK